MSEYCTCVQNEFYKREGFGDPFDSDRDNGVIALMRNFTLALAQVDDEVSAGVHNTEEHALMSTFMK